MKALIALTLVAMAGLASAFNYSADANGGYVTSDPAHTVTYAAVTPVSVYAGTAYWLNLTVDGVNYRGQVADQGVLGQLTEQVIVNGVAQYGTRTIIASANWTTTVTTGRYRITRRVVYSGTVQ